MSFISIIVRLCMDALSLAVGSRLMWSEVLFECHVKLVGLILSGTSMVTICLIVYIVIGVMQKLFLFSRFLSLLCFVVWWLPKGNLLVIYMLLEWLRTATCLSTGRWHLMLHGHGPRVIFESLVWRLVFYKMNTCHSTGCWYYWETGCWYYWDTEVSPFWVL